MNGRGYSMWALVAVMALEPGAFAQMRVDPPETAKSAAERVKAAKCDPNALPLDARRRVCYTYTCE